jgi:hypothetical protein
VNSHSGARVCRLIGGSRRECEAGCRGRTPALRGAPRTAPGGAVARQPMTAIRDGGGRLCGAPTPGTCTAATASSLAMSTRLKVRCLSGPYVTDRDRRPHRCSRANRRSPNGQRNTCRRVCAVHGEWSPAHLPTVCRARQRIIGKPEPGRSPPRVRPAATRSPTPTLSPRFLRARL